MKKYNIIAGLILFAGISMTNAQQCCASHSKGHKHGSSDEEKTIVMTKTELESFVNRVKELRRMKLAQQRAYRPNNNMIPVQPYNSYNNDYRSTEQLLRDLDNKLNILLYSNGRNTSNQIVPMNTPSTNTNAEYLMLQAKMAELERRLAADNMQQQLQPEVITQTNTETVTVNSKYDELFNKYGNYQKKYFFGNDSSKVSSADYASVYDAARIVREEAPHIKVQLKGFASKVGNPLYNVKLSERRTKAVKDILLSQGVSPSSIEILPLGVDASAHSDAQARRVELNLYIIK